MGKKTDISEEEQDLFRAEMGGVRPLQTDTVIPEHSRQGPRPAPRLREKLKNEQGAMDELPDAPETMELETAEELWFARPGLQHSVQRKLRRGQFRIETELDLHGMTVAEARSVLTEFLRHCRAEKMQCVRIIHGKGHSSENRRAVLKSRVNYWLSRWDDILAFCSARPADGGTGAVYVLLRRK